MNKLNIGVQPKDPGKPVKQRRMIGMKKWQSFSLRTVISFASILLLLFSQTYSMADNAFSADADAIEKAADSVFMLEVYSYDNRQIAVGSGFVAFDSSLLVTNYHVIENGSYVIAVSDDCEKCYK